MDPAFDAIRADGRTGVGMNGILWHPGCYLLVVCYDTCRLFRIPLDQPEQFTEVRLDQPVTGADGNRAARRDTPGSHGDYVLSSHPDLLFGSGGRRTADGLTLRRVN